MKIINRCFFILGLFAAATAANGQSADEIIAKHLEATGGKEKLGGITSVKYTNTNLLMGTEAPATVVILNGKGYRAEADMMGSKMVQVFTDKKAWMINPMMGSSTPEPLPEEAVKAGQAQIYVIPFLDYAAKGEKAEYLGQEKVGDANAYKIKLTDKNGTESTYYFDPSSYYLIQAVRSAEMMGQKLEVTTRYADFKKTDFGWVVPHTAEINMGQFALTTKTQKVEVNTPVDAAVFEMK